MRIRAQAGKSAILCCSFKGTSILLFTPLTAFLIRVSRVGFADGLRVWLRTRISLVATPGKYSRSLYDVQMDGAVYSIRAVSSFRVVRDPQDCKSNQAIYSSSPAFDQDRQSCHDTSGNPFQPFCFSWDSGKRPRPYQRQAYRAGYDIICSTMFLTLCYATTLFYQRETPRSFPLVG